MKCRACGREIDDNSRFCTFCDCDNFPQMNQVKTKNKHHRNPANNSSTVGKYNAPKPGSGYSNKYNKPQNSNTQKKSSSGGAGCIIAIIIIAIIYFIFMFLAN